MNREDSDLVRRITEGDQDALAAVFRAYGGAVNAVAFRVIRDEVLAEDVVQDTFVWLWRSPEAYDPGRGSLRTLLLTVARRRAVDIVRSEVARTRRESLPSESIPVDLEDEVLMRRLSADVRLALSDLTTGERQAISLAYFGGLSYIEVARHLGAPEGTIKSRIRSGMKKLAESLKEVAL